VSRSYVNPLLILAALFVTLNLIAPIASTKVSVLLGVTFATGSILVGVSYGFLDIINDWKGKDAAKETVLTALIVRTVFFLVVMPLVFALPTKAAPDGFDLFLGQSFRLFFAGLVSLWVSAWYVNTPLFSDLKERMQGRWFVLRYLVVSFPTFFVSTLVYIGIGFWGLPVDLAALVWGTMVARSVVAVLVSPIVWAVRRSLH
jgi:uncharacterized integral membrane protein (TIGR00697 family)